MYVYKIHMCSTQTVHNVRMYFGAYTVYTCIGIVDSQKYSTIQLFLMKYVMMVGPLQGSLCA